MVWHDPVIDALVIYIISQVGETDD